MPRKRKLCGAFLLRLVKQDGSALADFGMPILLILLKGSRQNR